MSGDEPHCPFCLEYRLIERIERSLCETTKGSTTTLWYCQVCGKNFLYRPLGR